MARLNYFRVLCCCLVYAFHYSAIVSEAASIGGDGAEEADKISESDQRQEDAYCPGYRPGNPVLVTSTEGCMTGVEMGVVDHMHAFGINQSETSPNWTACGIPALPGVNERVCYKTTVGQCEDGYHIYLNRRNLLTLQASCPNETDELPELPTGERFLQSPRYGCVNPENDRQLRYRKSELCLYRISMPECTSGKIVIDNELHYTQEIERWQRYNICTDYLQIFADSFVSERYCDTELSRSRLEIPATEFTALFWTDTSVNRLGFKLRVSCPEPASQI